MQQRLKRMIKKVLHYPSARGALQQWRAHTRSFHADCISRVHRNLRQVPQEDAVDELDMPWRLPDRTYPYSCTDEEGLALAYVIAANGLVSGFEIATAFGLSSLYIGLAMKQNAGSLCSVDCYVEEWKESYLYEPQELRKIVREIRAKMDFGHVPSGLAMAKANANALGLDDVIAFRLGISPEDVPALLDRKELDFVFIDGGHFGDQPTQDFHAIKPYLGSKCAVFFHDNNNPSVARAIEVAAGALGTQAQPLPTRFRLTLVHRGLDWGSLRMLHDALHYRHIQ